MKKRFFSIFTVISVILLTFSGCTQPTESPSNDPEVKTFTISFDSNGGTEVSSQTVKDGEKATKPENPTKDGFIFLEWYNGDSVYDFETPVHSNLELKAEWIDPDFNNPGNVDSVSFVISDIPEGIPSISIYRKYNTDADFSFYGYYYFYTAKERTLTFKDDFVDSGKTYQYKYSYKKTDKETVTVLVNNGETKNFTPSSGIGELKFIEPIPECTYNQKTTELTFENKLELSAVPETYYKALLISDNDNWLTITCPFEDSIFNLKEMFSHGKGKYNINCFGPAVNWSNWNYENNDNYALWILGKKYDIADKDIKLYFPSGLEAENVENGIKVYAAREDYEWENSVIEIYEDDVKIDCDFYINNVRSIKQRESISFVYPFVTAGKKYTFKFSPYEGKNYEVTVTADKTSSLQIDKNKLKENFYNAKLSYIENDTESKPSRLIKLSKDAKDIFIGITDSILQYNEYSVTMYVQNIESSWSGEIRENNNEYERLLTSGVDILEPSILTNEWWSTKYTVSSANKGKEIFFRPYLQISVDEKEYASGALVFVGEDSDLFNWTEVDETLFE